MSAFILGWLQITSAVVAGSSCQIPCIINRTVHGFVIHVHPIRSKANSMGAENKFSSHYDREIEKSGESGNSGLDEVPPLPVQAFL